MGYLNQRINQMLCLCTVGSKCSTCRDRSAGKALDKIVKKVNAVKDSSFAKNWIDLYNQLHKIKQ
jgi:hypothetical protein